MSRKTPLLSDADSQVIQVSAINEEPAINPFLYHGKWNLWELFKTFVTGPILCVIRILLFLVVLIFCLILCSIATCGLSYKQVDAAPLSRWRRVLLSPCSLIARIALFIFGFYWIPVKGQKASREEAPLLVVAPHSNLMDGFLIFWLNSPSIVSKAQNASIPLLGPILLSLQTVMVDRLSKTAREETLAKTAARAANPGYPQVMFFPEGTCTSAKCLIAFKQGAFAPGLPVQPVALTYKWCCYDPSYPHAGPNLLINFLRLLCQFSNSVEVNYLPVYKPNEQEKRDPILYANNVRAEMSKFLNLPCYEHSFEDIHLLDVAELLSIPASAVNVEFLALKRVCPSLKLAQAVLLLKRFAEADLDKDGLLHPEDFARSLGHPLTPALESLFNTLSGGSPHLTIRQFILSTSLLHASIVSDSRVNKSWNLLTSSGQTSIGLEQFVAALTSLHPPLSADFASTLFLRLVASTEDNDGLFDSEKERHRKMKKKLAQSAQEGHVEVNVVVDSALPLPPSARLLSSADWSRCLSVWPELALLLLPK